MPFGLLADPSTYYITSVHIMLLKSWNIHGHICLIKKIQAWSTGAKPRVQTFKVLNTASRLVLCSSWRSAHSRLIIYLPASGQQLLLSLLSNLRPCAATWSCHFAAAAENLFTLKTWWIWLKWAAGSRRMSKWPLFSDTQHFLLVWNKPDISSEPHC